MEKRSYVGMAIAAVLMLSLFSLLPRQQAQAQTVNLELAHRVTVFFTDGSSMSLDEYYVQFAKLTLISSNKIISHFDFRTIVVTDPSTPMFISSANIGIDIRVRNAQGDYVAIPQTGADKTPKKITLPDPCYEGCVTLDDQWQLFYLRVPASTIDNLIGSRSSDISSEIRFTARGPFTGVTITARINGVTDDYAAPLAILRVPLTAKATGGVEPQPELGPCTSGCTVTKPSGKLYYKVVINLPNGAVKVYPSVNVVNPLPADIFLTGQGGDEFTDEFTRIKWDLLLYLDNHENFNIPKAITYDSPGAAGNQQVSVNGQAVPFNHEAQIVNVGFGLYQLKSFSVNAADIEPKLDVLGEGPGGTNHVSGTLEVFNRHAVVELTSTQGTFDIDIPQQNVKLEIAGVVDAPVVEPPTGGGECDIIEGQTDCGGGLGLNELAVPIGIGVAVVAMIGGIAAAARKSKRQ